MAGDSGMTSVNWSDFGHMAPELLLGAVFIVLVIVDLLLPKRTEGRLIAGLIGGLTLAGLLGALALVGLGMTGIEERGVVSLFGDSYRIDGFSSMVKLLLLSGTAIVALLGLGEAGRDDAITEKGEYFYLLLPAAIGAMMMASSGSLVTLYVGIELLSITSYVLVGLRRRSYASAEAAFKYVVTGGISSAFILFGMSYLYGVTGSIQLAEIGAALPQAVADFEALVYVGFGCLLAGLAVKIAAAPFHAWAPDVYQGAPGAIASFLAVVSKGAALALTFRLMYTTTLFGGSGMAPDVRDDLFFALLLLAAVSMLAGSLAALRQLNARRLLALSGVANAGYLLVPIGLYITSTHSNNAAELMFYLTAYMMMTLGAFAVLSAVSRSSGHEELKVFSGMYYRAPWLAVAMLVFIVSLAGLPISAGFFGKLFILLGAAGAKSYWIVAVMVLSSVISYYFYFGIARQMFMRSGGPLEAGSERIPTGVPIAVVIWLCAAGTIVLGLFPGLLMDGVDAVFSFSRDFRP